MGVPKPADDVAASDTVKMEYPRRQEVPDPSRLPEEDPTVIQPVLRQPPAAADGD
jgi:hypothetical protein